MSALKIMIVEDEVIVAKDIQRILKKLGYEAFDPYANGKKALDAIEKINPDLILLDINLKSSKINKRYLIMLVNLFTNLNSVNFTALEINIKQN